jgi:hypothetical protein
MESIMKPNILHAVFGVVAIFATELCATSTAALTFTDNFSPPSSLWNNLPNLGNWTGGSGKYYAQAPNNGPQTWSALPFDFTNSNLWLTVTVNGLSDGGIWFDSYLPGGTGTGVLGVVLALGGNAYGYGCTSCAGAGNSIYWTVGPNYSQSLDEQQNIFVPLQTYTITVHVNGDTYQAFNDPDGVFDVNSVLLSTFVDSTFLSGQVGFYDFDSQLSFSNFSVEGTLVGEPPATPLPAALPLFATGLGALGWLGWLRRRKAATPA